MENLIKRILLVTYLTKYNIAEIYRSMYFEKFSDYIEDLLSRKPELNDNIVLEQNRFSLEKFDEMIYQGIKILPYFSQEFPSQLKKIDQCPPLLFYKGKIKAKENIAIIGSRVTTKYASETVDFFLDGLYPEENGIVSGLAKGIDTIAHSKSIAKGFYNIAVMANSLDSIYPSENYRLANKILEGGGAVVSELAIGINRGKKSFVERNRIQSGLSSYIIPIEMSYKSGTMHTIDFCIRQNRTVIYKAVSQEQVKMEQYSGIASLKQKPKLHQIVVNEKFDLRDIKDKSGNSKLTLFDI